MKDTPDIRSPPYEAKHTHEAKHTQSDMPTSGRTNNPAVKHDEWRAARRPGEWMRLWDAPGFNRLPGAARRAWRPASQSTLTIAVYRQRVLRLLDELSPREPARGHLQAMIQKVSWPRPAARERGRSVT